MDKITIKIWSQDNNDFINLIDSEIGGINDYNYIVYRLFNYIDKAVIDRIFDNIYYTIYLNEKITITLLNAVCENIVS